MGDEDIESLAALRSAAEADDDDAMHQLANRLKDHDPDAARQWWERAAELGNTRSMSALGHLLIHSDPPRAEALNRRAAEVDDLRAINNLGYLLKDRDPDEARRWFAKGAEIGDPDAMHNLALELRDSDPASSRYWYEQAAKRGQEGAMNNLGCLLLDSDPALALAWFERAYDGSTRSTSNMGLALERTGAGRKALPYYRIAAGRGDLEGIYGMWSVLRRRHPRQARVWLARAVELGEPELLKRVGEQTLVRSVLAPRRRGAHRRRAIELLERAANAGSEGATWDLGTLRLLAGDRTGAVTRYSVVVDDHVLARVALAVAFGRRDQPRAERLIAEDPHRLTRFAGRAYLAAGAALRRLTN